MPRQSQLQNFLVAAAAGQLDVVQNCYNLLGSDILFFEDEDNYTALHRASYNGKVNVLEYLLLKGANIHARTADGWQALHCACHSNKVDAVSLLLQNNAYINSLTNGKLSPLHLAASNNTAKATLELLLTHANINLSVCNNGDTAYDVACRYGYHGYLFEMVHDCIIITIA